MDDRSIVKRGIVLLLLLFFAFGIIGAHLFTLQIVEADKLRSYAWKEHNAVVVFSPRRGEILDVRGRLLALSVPSYSIYYFPAGGQLSEEKLKKVASLLSVSLKNLEKRIGKGNHFVWIKRRMPKEEAQRIRAELKRLKLRCFGFVEEDRRFYPNGKLASAVLGFTGIDDQGLAGVEYVYDDFLKGGRKDIFLRRDAGGGTIPDEKLLELPIKSSKRELFLTLDSRLQVFCEDILEKSVLRNRAKGGCLIVLGAKTGEVKAMAVYPPSRERNRAISWIFEPGSTLKPFLASAALEEGLAYPSMRFKCPGYIVYAGKRVRDVHAHGLLDLTGVIRESCNVGMITLALKMPAEIIYEYLRGFGFGDYTGIDLPGEEKGLLREPDKWYGLTRAVIAIGQGISVTAIQLASAMGAIANNGVLLKPFVVKELRSDDKVVYKARVRIVRKVISSDTAKMMKKMLVEVVEKGTGKKAAIPGIKVAGKTGTAQIPGKGGYEKGKYLSLFLGYMPAENPRWVILVVIEAPSAGKYYGGEVAAPVFSKVGQVLAKLYGLEVGD
ncbi:MAG: penicillin-binding protein 2 [Synergistetes bacterium]|nr:penicillin-binding protein 2 [Synergistota bacterium]